MTFSKFRVTVGATVRDGVTMPPRSLPATQPGTAILNMAGYVDESCPCGHTTNAFATLDGTWSGTSSTGQVNTLLHLSESNGYIAGDLKWPNDSRSISESRSGETIQFYVEGGDRWSLVFANDNTLVGTAVKPDGNTYALSFTR